MISDCWMPMTSAPKDGQAIRIAVHGRKGFKRPQMHELPYEVAWDGRRWCYARNMAPLFDWHQPRFWKPSEDHGAAAA